MSTTYIPLTGLKRKESDPDIGYPGSGGDKDRDRDRDRDRGALAGSGQQTVTKEGRRSSLVASGADVEVVVGRAEGAQLKSVGIFRLAGILFFMGYGGSYGVEGNLISLVLLLPKEKKKKKQKKKKEECLGGVWSVFLHLLEYLMQVSSPLVRLAMY